MRIFRLQSLAIFRSGTPGRLALAGWDFRMGFFVWKLPFESVRSEVSIANFRSGSLACRLIAFVWGPSLRNFRFGTFVLELSFWNCRLGTFA